MAKKDPLVFGLLGSIVVSSSLIFSMNEGKKQADEHMSTHSVTHNSTYPSHANNKYQTTFYSTEQ